MTGILVHEWLEPSGGAENVFEQLTAAFPDAARLCLWNDSRGRFRDVEETVLARTPLRRSKAAALPFMPAVWRRLPQREADWVLCSSHLFAHHARFRGPARDAPKLVYAHTPARYIWAPELDARGRGPMARAASAILKPLDRRRAQEPVAIAANSAFVADRIARSWDRAATVIHPPVDLRRFAPDTAPADPDRGVLAGLPDGYLLGVSRFVGYKRLDAVIDAGIATGRPVVLAGSGPDEARLRALAAGHPVTFVVAPSDAVLAELYRRAAALVFAPIEDFGIVPVEAMASGTPVVAGGVGGQSESVVDGRTGVLVESWDRDEVADAVTRAVALSAEDCRARAADFGPDAFVARIREWATASIAADASPAQRG